MALKKALDFSPTVLVVDDEELMREVVEVMIMDNGGKVLTAVDGADAVEKFSGAKNDIDLVLMDFSMPRKDGYEAYKEIQELKSGVPVIFISGLKMSAEVEQACKEGRARFVPKPFKEDRLLDEITEALKK